MRGNLQEIWTWEGISNSCKLHSGQQWGSRFATLSTTGWRAADGKTGGNGIQIGCRKYLNSTTAFLVSLLLECWWSADCMFLWSLIWTGTNLDLWRTVWVGVRGDWPDLRCGDNKRKDTCSTGKGSGRGREWHVGNSYLFRESRNFLLFGAKCLGIRHVGVYTSTPVCWGQF